MVGTSHLSLTRAKESAKALFSGGNAAEMPTAAITETDLRDGCIDILGLLVSASLAESRAQARRNVEQGGVTVNGEKITDIRKTYTPEEIMAQDFVLKRGKKKFCRVIYK